MVSIRKLTDFKKEKSAVILSIQSFYQWKMEDCVYTRIRIDTDRKESK